MHEKGFLLPHPGEREQTQSASHVRVHRRVQRRVEDHRGGGVDDRVDLPREFGEVLGPRPRESECTSPSRTRTFSATRSSNASPSSSRRREKAVEPRTSVSNLSLAPLSREGRTSR